MRKARLYGVRWLDTALAMGAKLPLGVASGVERLGVTRDVRFSVVAGFPFNETAVFRGHRFPPSAGGRGMSFAHTEKAVSSHRTP